MPLVCNQRTRLWRIYTLQHLVAKSVFVNVDLSLKDGSQQYPPATVIRFVAGHLGIHFQVFPTKVSDYALRKVSDDQVAEKVFEDDFLSWEPPATMVRPDGSKLHFRLVEGIFSYAAPSTYFACVTTKMGICEPPPGSGKHVTSVCVGSITRIG